MRGDWGEKEGNACYNNPVLGWRPQILIGYNQTIEQACSANQTGDFS